MQNQYKIIIKALSEKVEKLESEKQILESENKLLQFNLESTKNKLNEFPDKLELIEKHYAFLSTLGARDDIYFKLTDRFLPLRKGEMYQIVPVSYLEKLENK